MVQHIFVVRHGSTAFNEKHQLRGWKDVPLSPEGKKEVKATAEKLLKEQVDLILSSDLERSEDTAKIISTITKRPIVLITKNLRPWDLGDFAGQDSNKAGPILQKYIETKPDEKIPGGESFDVFKERWLTAFLSALEKYKSERIVIVTHHRGERLLEAWIAGGADPDYAIETKFMAREGIKPGAFTHYHGIWSKKQQKLV